MSDQVRRFFNIPADKIQVIYNGVNVSEQPALNNGERVEFRARYAEAGQPIIVYVGRIVAEKGVQVLVDAAPDVSRDLAERDLS